MAWLFHFPHNKTEKRIKIILNLFLNLKYYKGSEGANITRRKNSESSEKQLKNLTVKKKLTQKTKNFTQNKAQKQDVTLKA